MIGKLFKFLMLIKLYHWNTKSFARHKATDRCFEKLLENLDDFIEAYIGRYGRNIVTREKNTNIKLQILSDKQMEQELVGLLKYLENLDVQDTDLLNIRDEMLSVIKKTLYLFTLN